MISMTVVSYEKILQNIGVYYSTFTVVDVYIHESRVKLGVMVRLVYSQAR